MVPELSHTQQKLEGWGRRKENRATEHTCAEHIRVQRQSCYGEGEGDCAKHVDIDMDNKKPTLCMYGTEDCTSAFLHELGFILAIVPDFKKLTISFPGKVVNSYSTMQ